MNVTITMSQEAAALLYGFVDMAGATDLQHILEHLGFLDPDKANAAPYGIEAKQAIADATGFSNIGDAAAVVQYLEQAVEIGGNAVVFDIVAGTATVSGLAFTLADIDAIKDRLTP